MAHSLLVRNLTCEHLELRRIAVLSPPSSHRHGHQRAHAHQHGHQHAEPYIRHPDLQQIEQNSEDHETSEPRLSGSDQPGSSSPNKDLVPSHLDISLPIECCHTREAPISPLWSSDLQISLLHAESLHGIGHKKSLAVDGHAEDDTIDNHAQDLARDSQSQTLDCNGHAQISSDLSVRCHKGSCHYRVSAGYQTIYHASTPTLPDPHITLLPSIDFSQWMRPLPDKVDLSLLSIPGTHNSPAYHVALPTVRCQGLSVRDQLRNGIRFLDVRLQVDRSANVDKVSQKDLNRPSVSDGISGHSAACDGVKLVHSVFPVGLLGGYKFRKLVDDILVFLEAHPSETVIMSLKREGLPARSITDADLEIILRTHYVDHKPSSWYTDSAIPRLGQVRGKIVLFRRFALSQSQEPLTENPSSPTDGHAPKPSHLEFGIDASVWADNTSHAVCGSGQVCIQDFYNVQGLECLRRKIEYAREHMARAAKAATKSAFVRQLHQRSLDAQSKNQLPPHSHDDADGVTDMSRIHSDHEAEAPPLLINFLSASNLWHPACWPHRVAAHVNPAMVEYLCREHGVHVDVDHDVDEPGPPVTTTGVVVGDWLGDGPGGTGWALVACVVGMNAWLLHRH